VTLGTDALYLDVDEAMRRSTEALAETAALLATLPVQAKVDDVLALERVRRRTENAAAQLELDRRLVAETRRIR
jgi:hypothetical protein